MSTTGIVFLGMACFCGGLLIGWAVSVLALEKLIQKHVETERDNLEDFNIELIRLKAAAEDLKTQASRLKAKQIRGKL
jgi:hypothetical protein